MSKKSKRNKQPRAVGTMQAKANGNLRLNLQSELEQGITVSKNISKDLILIDSAKAKLVLSENLQHIQAKSSWVTPSSIAFTLFLSIITADFKSIFGIPSEMWRGFFFAGLFVTALMAILKGWIAHCSKGVTIDSIIEEFKQDSEKPKSTR